MKVTIGPPRRTVEIDGVTTVIGLLARLELDRESHLVIRNGTLVPSDSALADSDEVEIRRVISGGAGE